MGNWDRLHRACKEATGADIEDIYDAHLVVEELANTVSELKAENKRLREKKLKKGAPVSFYLDLDEKIGTITRLDEKYADVAGTNFSCSGVLIDDLNLL